MLANILKGASAAAQQVGLTYNATASNTTDASTYNFASISIGSAPSAGVNRLVVVAIAATQGTGTATISSVSINGNSASFFTSNLASGLGGNNIGFAYAVVNSGTTASVDVTFAVTQQRVRIYSYSVLGADTLAAANFDFNNIAGGTPGSPTVSLDVTRKGATIVVGISRTTSGFTSVAGQGTLTQNEVSTLESQVTIGTWSELISTTTLQTYSITAAGNASARAIGVLTIPPA
jgi:hypothetical protein